MIPMFRIVAYCVITCVMMISPAMALEWTSSGMYWSSFSTRVTDEGKFYGTPVCGMVTAVGGEANNAAITIKYLRGQPGLLVQIFKRSWRFRPQMAFDVRLNFYLDDHQPLGVVAGGRKQLGDFGMIAFAIHPTRVADFLRQFADANWMTVVFTDRTDGNWKATMQGSRDAVNNFRTCVASLKITPLPTPPSIDPGVPIEIKTDGGAWVDVKVGGYTAVMLIDTGAIYTKLTYSLAETLIESGHAKVIRKGRALLADGSVVPTLELTIDEMKIGNHIIHNVMASTMEHNESDMLLGFMALNQIGPFTIDASKGRLIFMTTQ
jgi:predicted aspartyl protease